VFENWTAGQDRGVIFYRDVSQRASREGEFPYSRLRPFATRPGPTGLNAGLPSAVYSAAMGPSVLENSSAWGDTREGMTMANRMVRTPEDVSLKKK
jgi:hypothetical protein